MALFPIKRIGSLDMRPLIQPVKDGYKVTKSDLYSDNSRRTSETGSMLLYPIRKNVYSIEVTYSGTAEQIAEVDAAMNGSSTYLVEFLDSGSYVEKIMYFSDRSKETSVIIDGVQYEQLSFSLIEV